MKTPKVFRRFYDDLIRVEFIALKILNFLTIGAMFALFPFLTIQAKSLGIRAEELGSIYAVLPFLGLLASVLASMVADKIGNFKVFLSSMFVISGLLSLSFLAIPVGRVTHQLPLDLPLNLTCDDNGPGVKVQLPYQCDFLSVTQDAVVKKCNFKCSPERQTTLPLSAFLDIGLCSVTPECFLENKYPYEGMPNTTKEASGIKEHEDEVRVQLNIVEIQEKQEATLNNSFCPDYSKFDEDSSYFPFKYEKNSSSSVCRLECMATTESLPLCSNSDTVEDINPRLTIALYILVRIIHSMALVCSLPLYEGAELSILQEKQGDIGIQRVYSNIGQIVLTPLSGVLIDAFSTEGTTNFRPAFYLYCGMGLLTAFFILFIDLQFRKPTKQLTREIRKVLLKPEVTAFLVVCFSVGITLGVLDTFLFWNLENMGASKTLMGVTVTVGSVFGIPILLYATPIIEKFGHLNILVFALIVYVIRLIGYSLVTEPWWVLPFEAMECFTASLFGATQISYTACLASPSTMVTLQGISLALLYGVGRGLGSMIGGFLTEYIGIRGSFLIIAFFCGIIALTYGILSALFFRKHEKARKAETNETNKDGSSNQEKQ